MPRSEICQITVVITFLILAFIFLFFVLLTMGLLVIWFLGIKIYSFRFKLCLGLLYLSYFGFILFATGPVDLTIYPPQATSEYFLPWENGVTYFTSQGNRSFTSHRDLHERAWDFVMPIGTKILASRKGVVVEVEDSLDGVGWRANFVKIKHTDGTIAGYFHIQKNSAQVKVGEEVRGAQWIASCGMVGITTHPHLHFAVFNSDQSQSLPISFRDVDGGVPFAGRFYKSENESDKRKKEAPLR